jgi:AcrR family transcriptional regulator
MGTEQRRQREREARQEVILDAAERVIAERGLWATTMEDVAAAAELSKGTLYLYFANKDALCAALAARTMSLFHPHLFRAIAAESVGLEKLRVALRTMAKFFLGHPHVFRMAVSWILAGVQSTDSPEFDAYRKHVSTTLAHAMAAVELGRRDGSIREDADPQLTAISLWTGLLGTLLGAIQSADLSHRMSLTIDPEPLVENYVRNVLRGLEGSASGAKNASRETPLPPRS